MLMNSVICKSFSPKHLIASGLTFSVFSEEEMKKLSVVKITSPLSFNALGHAYKGGLYDPALGPSTDRFQVCTTCEKFAVNCTGHFGHIELPIPAVNPLFHKIVFSVLKLACLQCHTLQVKGYMKHVYITKIHLLMRGRFLEAQEVDQVVGELISSEHAPSYTEAVEIMVKKKLDEFYSECLQSGAEESWKETRIVESIMNNVMAVMDKLKPDWNVCYNCQAPLKKVHLYRKKFLTNVKKSEVEPTEKGKQDDRMVTTVILPDELRNHLRRIWSNEAEFIKALVPVLRSCSMEFPTDAFFISTILVTPSKMRPVSHLDGRIAEYPQTEALKLILNDTIVIQNVIKAIQDGDTSNLSVEGWNMIDQMQGKTLLEKLDIAYESLQNNVNNLVDNPPGLQRDYYPGIKQIIEKKKGILRMNMMGKRVDYAARTVITPDPYLNIEEIGIPEVFARSLTYPVPVTPWNVEELRRMVLNGPDVHPGAVLVQFENGFITKLKEGPQKNRRHVAKCLLTPVETNVPFRAKKIVYRHLLDGDVVLVNRQPSLHKPSIMAHVARVLKGQKTLRLHYANCKAYNADFDGDEMNIHFPQNEVARSEAYNLLNVKNQYVVPKDGTPLSGLIQDHVIAGVRLSVRGRFFEREEYMQLVYQALAYKEKDVKLLPPAILKPRRLWSGKQIISTVIINIVPEKRHPLNLWSSAKISDKAWVVEKPRRWFAGGTPFTDHSMSEAEVIIQEGELLCGVLDKTHYGATPYGLVHCMNELYGGSCSGDMLSALSKLFNAFLQREGFTLGIEDILVVSRAEEERKKFIYQARMIGDAAVKHAVNLPEEATVDEMKKKMELVYENKDKGRAIVDSAYKEFLDKYTNNINSSCIPSGLQKCFPHNNLQLMIQSGAKGSTVNAMQISCLLGQIELEGRRPPHMVSGKSLPSFARFETTPRAGGFIDGRFMTGIKPQEFFFHCMAGREGLVDTAVKTSRSGYLQRCLIKHLEGLTVGYDTTVRDSDGTIVQFLYGEDGLDVTKSQFLKKKQMPILAENCKAVTDTALDRKEDSETYFLIKKRRKQIHQWKKQHGDPLKKTRMSPFLLFSSQAHVPSSDKHKEINKKTGRSRSAEMLCDMWREADTETVERYNYESERCADPVVSEHQIDRDFGALTEQLEKLMEDYMKTRSHQHKSEMLEMMAVKTLQSCAQPGEPVGLLAAQSIGEPSTQMTLNTFHFAGRGEMNVTLGIPRLRELLMTASENIKTPYMDIPFRSDVHKIKKKADKLKKKLCRVTVADLLQFIEVKDRMDVTNISRGYIYEIHFQFLPHKAYKSKFYVDPSYVLQYIEKRFIKKLLSVLKRVWTSKNSVVHTEDSKPRSARRRGGDEDGDKDEERPDPAARSLNNEGEDHESSDEEQEDPDDDATLSRSKKKHRENIEYEESEEENSEDEEIEDDGGGDSKPPQDVYASDAENKSDEEEDDDKQLLSEKEKDSQVRRQRLVADNIYVYDYEYDIRRELWCKVTLRIPVTYRRIDLTSCLRELAAKSFVWETPMMKRAFTYVNDDTQKLMLKTEGTNFQQIFKFNQILDLNRIYSNDIHKMAATYGIEAARRVIVKEIQDVFKVYGIVVDPRHLLLVADYMTFNGKYEAFSRIGIANNASPLQQMTFEASIAFLKTALSRGKRDNLQSPSSRLMIGKPAIGGTGCFSLEQKLSY